MIHFVLLISRQGKVRLTKWYSPYSQKERTKVVRELSGLILTRDPKLCNFVEWRGFKVVYKRYASLYFCMCINEDDNELEILEIVHYFVEILDRYFGSVCELHLIFNFHKKNFWHRLVRWPVMKAASFFAMVLCMELAKQQCDPQFLSLAIRSLKRAQGTSLNPLPIVSLLLAQAEGSFESQAKWEKNLQHEWFSWPPGFSFYEPDKLF